MTSSAASSAGAGGPPRSPGSVPERPRRLRAFRWVLAGVLALAVALLLALVVIRQPGVGTRLANAVLSRVSPLPRAKARVADVRGDWIGWLELRGLTVTRGDTLLAAVDTLRARYDMMALLAGRLDVHEVALAGVRVTADARDTTRTESKGPSLTLGQILQGRFYGGLPIRVLRLSVVNAEIGGRAGAPDTGFRLARLTLRARDLQLGRGFGFRVDSLVGTLHPGAGRRDSVRFDVAAALAAGRAELGRLRFSGDSSDVEGHGELAIGARDTLQGADLTLRAQPLSFGDLAGFVPGLPLAGALYADVEFHGTRADRLSGGARARIDRARVGALALDACSLEAAMDAGRADATVRARIEGAALALHGTGTPLAASPAYALELNADRLPERLPGLPGWEPLAARVRARLALNVKGVGYSPATMDIAGKLDGDAGALTWDGHVGFGPAIEWELRSLAFDRVDVARIAGLEQHSAFRGHVSGSGSVARDGSARAQAELVLLESSLGSAHIRSAGVRAKLEGATVSGALQLDTDAGALDVGSFALDTAAGGASHVRDARFRDIDLSRLLDQPALAGRLAGTFTLEARDLTRLGAGSRGLLDPGPRADATLELAPSTFRGQSIEHGEAQVSLTRGSSTATVELATHAGNARLTASGQPFAHPASVRVDELHFEHLDLGAWSGVQGLASDLAGAASGAFHARGGPDQPAGGSAMLSLARSRIGGTVLDGGELRADLGESQATLQASLRTSGSALSLHAQGSVHDRRTEGSVDCSVPFTLLAAIAGRDSLPCHGALVTAAHFAADAAAPLHADGSVRGSGAVGRSRLDTLAASFRLERGLLRVDTLLARSNLATVTGGGRVAIDRHAGTSSSDLRLHVVARDVSPLREILRADTVALASGSIDVSLEGSDSVRTVALDGTLRSLAWNDLRLSGAELSAAGELDRAWRPVTGSSRVSLRQLQGLPLPLGSAAAEASLDHARVAFLVAAATDARTRARVRGQAAFDSLETVVTLDSLAVDADTASWRLSKPTRLMLSATRFHLDPLDVDSRGGRLSARGGIDRRGTQDLDVELHHVTLPSLAALVGRRDLSGVVEGRLTVRGPAERPNAEGGATLALFTGGQPAGSVSVQGTWSDRRARVDGALATPRADSLTWSAELPLAASLAERKAAAGEPVAPAFEGPVHVRVLASHFPLASLAPFLDPIAVGTPSGTLDVNARLDGNERSLAGSGRLDVSGGVLPLPVLKVTYRDLTAHMEFEGDRLVIRDLGVTSGKGTLAASGDVRFASVSRIEPRVKLTTKKFVFADSPDLKATATCDVDVSGTLGAPVVKGKVTVASSSFTITQSDLAAGAGSDVMLTPADVRMMEETFGYVAPRAPALPLQLYDDSDLELAIKMERDNWVRQRVTPKMAVALTGDFRLVKRPHADPELYGKIEPIPNRGYVQQFARSFDIVGGDVLLNGKMKDHAVSIHAQFKPESGVESQSSTDVVVKLDVEGTPDHLRLTLSSEPPMSETEIVNFIATGRSSVASPTATTGSSESSLIKDIGMSQLTGLAESAAQEAVGLDVLEVRYDPLRGATLVAGRYVDPQLYVGFRSPLDYNQNTSTNTSNSVVNSTAFEVEYAISRWLVFNCQGETSKLRSFFRARRAY